MSDPDCCPRCGTFWNYHDEQACADDVHRENERLREANGVLSQDLSAQAVALREARTALAFFLRDGRFNVAIGGNPHAIAQMMEQASAALVRLDALPADRQEPTDGQ